MAGKFTAVIPCKKCGVPYEEENAKNPYYFDAMKQCPPCREATDKEWAVIAENARIEREASERQQRRSAWESICPPLYRDTDLSRLPRGLVALLEWQYGPLGLGITGAAGIGKTRIAFKILETHFLQGIDAAAVSSTKFSRKCADQFDDPKAKAYLGIWRRVPLLLFDDVGKAKMTERAEMEFFDLLEHRTSHLLPIIWTANAAGDALLNMMSPDRGEPIIRRLAEFSKII